MKTDKEKLLIIECSYKSGYFYVKDIKMIRYATSWNEIHIHDMSNEDCTFSNESDRPIQEVFEELQKNVYLLKTDQLDVYTLNLRKKHKEEKKFDEIGTFIKNGIEW